MTIRAILTRPLPPPKRTVGTMLVAVALGVAQDLIRRQQRQAITDRLDRHHRRIERFMPALHTTSVSLNSRVDNLLLDLNDTITGQRTIGRKLDTLVSELHVQGIDVTKTLTTWNGQEDLDRTNAERRLRGAAATRDMLNRVQRDVDAEVVRQGKIMDVARARHAERKRQRGE